VVDGHFRETWAETHSTRPRCDSLVFVAIYSDLFRCRLAFADIYVVENFNALRKQVVSFPSCAFASTSKRSTSRPDRRSCPASGAFPPFLPLLVFARVIPFRRISRCVASPSVLPHLWRDGASRFRSVRSRGFSHLSGFSHTPVPDVLQSGPTLGFAAFPLVIDPVDDFGRSLVFLWPATGFPDSAVRTPRSIPLVSSRTALLQPLPS
jgi:hypothetical protein